LWITRIEALWTGRTSPITEDRKTDLMKFHRVAMAAPDDDAGQPAGPCFESRQISNAAFIQPALIVNDKDVSLMRAAHRFEKDIHTAVVPDGQSLASNMRFHAQWMNARWRYS
jgi:hypothetical protein